MASGDAVVQVLYILPPAANAARPSFRAGGSTPGERVPVWLFHQSNVEYLDFLCILRGYDGGGLTFSHKYFCDATSGDWIASSALRRVNDASEDIDASQTYDFNDATETIPGTAGQPGQVNIAFTNGSDMDNVADGDLFIYRLRRRSDQGGDTVNSNDIQFIGFDGYET